MPASYNRKKVEGGGKRKTGQGKEGGVTAGVDSGRHKGSHTLFGPKQDAYGGYHQILF